MSSIPLPTFFITYSSSSEPVLTSNAYSVFLEARISWMDGRTSSAPYVDTESVEYSESECSPLPLPLHCASSSRNLTWEHLWADRDAKRRAENPQRISRPAQCSLPLRACPFHIYLVDKPPDEYGVLLYSHILQQEANAKNELRGT